MFDFITWKLAWMVLLGFALVSFAIISIVVTARGIPEALAMIRQLSGKKDEE